MPPSDRFISKTRFHVRYAETDAMGIVHHSSYIIYFEEGRSSYARERGSSYADFEKAGFYLTVTEVHARYLKPARYDQQLNLYCWVEEMKSRSLVFAYEITDASTDELLVSGQTKHVCITHAGQVARLPESWRAWANS